jgi:hypothetical protein
VAVRIILAGHAGVADVSGAPVRPAVGIGCEKACWGGGAMNERRRSCCSQIYVANFGRLVRSSYSLIGAMATGSLGRCGTTGIEIGIAKGGLECLKDFVGLDFGAPIAAAGGEETGGLDDVVSTSDGSGGRDRVVSCCRANRGAFQLGEERFDRERGR